MLLSSLGMKAERWDVHFVTPSIVRVQISNSDELVNNNTGVCIYTAKSVEVTRKETANEVVFGSSQLSVVYDKSHSTITFIDSNGKTVLKQLSCKTEPVVQENVTYDESTAHVEETANGKVTVRDVVRRDTIGRSTRYYATFQSEGEKAVYGLGCQMEDYMNLQGKTVYLTQHNLKVHVPMLVSTNGYGLLFDAGCAMKYSSEKVDAEYNYTMQLEAAKELDYYFIKGEKPEDVVAGYRYLTGNVSMMPRYIFGYTQSKERYSSSAELISTLKEYRRRHVPIDMIVQDWNYWPQGWGYMKMDPKYYPDPKALADSVHAMNAKLMVSIWPNPQWCPEADDFKQRGMMLPNDVYDVFNPEARKHYWKYANDEFFSRGFDAWWCDSSEPLDGDWNRIPATTPDGNKYGWDSHEYRWNLNKNVLSESLGIERSSLYSLYHSMGIYENQRAEIVNCKLSNCQIKRVVNLTRSSYAGQQRYGTIVWNGDTHASWESFRQQIPSGLNYMATGNPYWTVDVGSFFVKDDGRRWFYKGEFPEGVKDDAYKEYYVRMFQWATFLPMLRSHGSDTPREIWQFGEPGTPYYDAILRMINLRYAHIPYIYSMAAKQTNSGYSMARPLAFDYPEDEKVLDIKDEYMFGDFLVCPVTHPMSETESRNVYLPSGNNWIDFNSGKIYAGGSSIKVKTTIGTIPLFIREGSIIPTHTQVAEFTEAQAQLPITINVFYGKDATFTLYEDEGDNYNFEQGKYSSIKMTWNNKKRTLTIGKRQGSFDGMQDKRQFKVFLFGPDGGEKDITYKGKKKTINL